MQEPFHAQRLELPQQLGRAQRLSHGAHQVQLDTDRQERWREPLVTDTLHRAGGCTQDSGSEDREGTCNRTDPGGWTLPPRLCKVLYKSQQCALLVTVRKAIRKGYKSFQQSDEKYQAHKREENSRRAYYISLRVKGGLNMPEERVAGGSLRQHKKSGILNISKCFLT